MITKRIICTCVYQLDLNQNKCASLKEQQKRRKKKRITYGCKHIIFFFFFHFTMQIKCVCHSRANCLWIRSVKFRSYKNAITYSREKKTVVVVVMVMVPPYMHSNILIFFFFSHLLFIFIYVHKLIININKVILKSSMMRTAGLINKLKQIAA